MQEAQEVQTMTAVNWQKDYLQFFQFSHDIQFVVSFTPHSV